MNGEAVTMLETSELAEQEKVFEVI